MRQSRLKTHAAQVRCHITKLAASLMGSIPPAQSSSACSIRAKRFQCGTEAGPHRLSSMASTRKCCLPRNNAIALLRAVAYGGGRAVGRERFQISDSGRTVRAGEGHGGALCQSAKGPQPHYRSYNKADGALVASARLGRRFKNWRKRGSEIGELEPVEKLPRELQARELILDAPPLPEPMAKRLNTRQQNSRITNGRAGHGSLCNSISVIC